ncbi:hypothetical protein CRG98_022182 [Punica granatum]|uniref:Uncharacterized protein n=1 Tax=Punica granatum TaxID=22663 RepID=A0A2I0JMM9_PUNGR|nr:hypothetical protein CRG98_022182 [Punica granatum]
MAIGDGNLTNLRGRNRTVTVTFSFSFSLLLLDSGRSSPGGGGGDRLGPELGVPEDVGAVAGEDEEREEGWEEEAEEGVTGRFDAGGGGAGDFRDRNGEIVEAEDLCDLELEPNIAGGRDGQTDIPLRFSINNWSKLFKMVRTVAGRSDGSGGLLGLQVLGGPAMDWVSW